MSGAPISLPQEQIYIYSGTYTVNSTTAPTTGCFYLFTTTNGSTVAGTSVPYSALAAGFPNETTPSFSITNATSGAFTTLSLSVNASGTGSGAFALSNGDSGTITVTGRFTAQTPTGLALMRHS